MHMHRRPEGGALVALAPPPSPGYGAPFPPPPIPKTIINYYNPKRLQHAEHDLASSARSHALLATIQSQTVTRVSKVS